MDMAMDCKISMLWNWYTEGACFISDSWMIKSKAAFAVSCLGVVLLVVSLELLRRVSREYERFIVRKKGQQRTLHPSDKAAFQSSSGEEDHMAKAGHAVVTGVVASPREGVYRPTVVQQVIRAALHMLQFGVAYFIMLLAMYYNGYFIICILIGAFLGSFLFNWDTLGGSKQRNDATETTYCCG